MKTDELKHLVEKFFDGETSVEEERLLKVYFSGENIPEQFQEMKAYFTALQNETEQALDDAFEQRVFEKTEEDVPRPGNRKRWIYGVVAAAATVLLLLWFGTKVFSTKEEYGTIKDPVLAFNETRKALDLAAVEMNKGMSPAEQTVKTVDDNLKKVYQLEKWNSALEKTGKLLQTSNHILSKGNL